MVKKPENNRLLEKELRINCVNALYESVVNKSVYVGLWEIGVTNARKIH